MAAGLRQVLQTVGFYRRANSVLARNLLIRDLDYVDSDISDMPLVLRAENFCVVL